MQNRYRRIQFRQEAEKAMANISKKKASADVADDADAQAAFKAELDERLEQAAAQAAANILVTIAESLPARLGLKWTIDIDPQDLF